MIKVTRNSKLDIKETLKFHAKTFAQNQGRSIVESVDHFFVSQAGSR